MDNLQSGFAKNPCFNFTATFFFRGSQPLATRISPHIIQSKGPNHPSADIAKYSRILPAKGDSSQPAWRGERRLITRVFLVTRKSYTRHLARIDDTARHPGCQLVKHTSRRSCGEVQEPTHVLATYMVHDPKEPMHPNFQVKSRDSVPSRINAESDVYASLETVSDAD